MSPSLGALIGRFAARSPWSLSAHDAPCCRRARAWCLLQARAAPNTEALVSWVHERWSWGPHPWPLYWCQLPAARQLDCEAAAHVVVVALRARRVETLEIQLIECFDASATAHWREAWRRADVPCDWLDAEFAYHAVVASRERDRWLAWDPSDGCALEDKPLEGYDAAVAVRVAGGPRGWQVGVSLESVLRSLAMGR